MAPISWQEKKKFVVFCAVAAALCVVSTHNARKRRRKRNQDYVDREPSTIRHLERSQYIDRLVNERNIDCHNQLRMGKDAFVRLSRILRETGRLRDTLHCSAEEQLARFLHTLSHNVKNRVIGFNFKRSGETVSRQFHQLLNAILTLEDRYLIQPKGNAIPPEITNNANFWPYFKDCVGAIDGTQLPAKVPREEVARFRGRKPYPTQNILAVCSFDLKFTYVLPGWEGTASYLRVLNSALTREDKLIVPPGKYYLVDAEFQLETGFLAPFHSTRYHFKEYIGHKPENSRELFNLRHSSLRDAIERTLGILKKRFPILSCQQSFPFPTQVKIVQACCILHNHIMGIDPNDPIVQEVDGEMQTKDLPPEEVEAITVLPSRDEECREGIMLRQQIANWMWHDYNTNGQL